MVFVNAMQYTKVADDEHLEDTFDDTKAEYAGIETDEEAHLGHGTTTTTTAQKPSRRRLWIGVGATIAILLAVLVVMLFILRPEMSMLHKTASQASTNTTSEASHAAESKVSTASSTDIETEDLQDVNGQRTGTSTPSDATLSNVPADNLVGAVPISSRLGQRSLPLDLLD
ncbi:hypothetical protein BCR37DRAFT_379288 [Protomyces lactucae-debilis]|uniref:Uncharacterized protein n=1 Tax=Protomyces lactucae-debilis TaxID=2754530 RepID=A0A1Y2FIQ4_PROLT|nr:uncharacterized protein BCR37DRAFT_379288 [Protomyces lactucae-debilis]ORY83264.1 hypothetical protein BCR37DRAFT_379288 [Protomyces lactucae-debilis]